MERGKDTLLLQLGTEQLQLVGLDKLARTQTHWEEKRHCNAQWELHLILEGACRVDLEERSCVLLAGQALLIPPGQYHRPQHAAGAFRRLSLVFQVQKGTLWQQLVAACPDSRVLEPGERLLQLAQDITREVAEEHPFRQICLEAMLTQYIVGMLRMMGLREEPEMEKISDSSRITDLIDAYFEANFTKSAGEQVLADLLHISRRQLVRILQVNYGMNFRQKLQKTRMDYAAWLLATTSRSVADIGQEVGYSSEAAFFKLFKRAFGMTPKAYRSAKAGEKKHV